MKKLILVILILPFSLFCQGQEKVDWGRDVEITIESFKGKLPDLKEDKVQQYSLASFYEFNGHMRIFQFAFAKHFNQYVSVYYIPSDSWIEDGEQTEEILMIANLNFDLLELYSRKFRKKIFESKTFNSSFDFINKIYEEISRDLSEKQATISNEIRNQDDLSVYLADQIKLVNFEIEKLDEFCKTCVPKKKKRRRKN